MNCKHLHEIKSMELFLLFRGFYRKEELAYLFHPIVGKSLDFRSLILEKLSEGGPGGRVGKK